MRRHLVVREIDRADADAIDALARAGVATVHEAMGRTGLLEPAIRPIQQGVRHAGSAVTVLCQPGDNLMIHAAVEVCREGDVLVVTTTSPSTDGMFGELLATSFRARGVNALIMDAGVRDVEELRQLAFHVWARAVHAQGTVKATPGSVNVPITCGGARVNPGDVIVADDDGVCVVPRAHAREAQQRSDARLAKEAETRKVLASGELGVDRYGLRQKLADLGVEYVDRSRDSDGS